MLIFITFTLHQGEKISELSVISSFFHRKGNMDDGSF
jgi:hypothetical protein